MARRGGRRPRRYITPGRDADVWVSSGRWGARRARVEQCATLAAELVYHHLLCNGEELGPGWRARLKWTPNNADVSSIVEAEIVENAVWRRGRLFFRCAACQRRATRLYVPVAGVQPRCRRCWGLSYESRSWSYKATGFLAALGPIAYATTLERRERRRESARARYDERRSRLRRPES